MNRKVAELETDLAGLDVIFLERRDPVAAEHAARGAATRSVFDQLERGVGVAHHETALGRFAYHLGPVLSRRRCRRGDRCRRRVPVAASAAAARGKPELIGRVPCRERGWWVVVIP